METSRSEEPKRRGAAGRRSSRARTTWTATSTRRRCSRPKRRSYATRRPKKRHASPARPKRDVLLFLLEHAPLEDWQGDCLVDRPRGGVLLRAAGHDQDHERRLGHATGTRTIMTKHFVEAVGDHRLRRPPLRHDGHMPPGSSTRTSSASSCSATSRTAGTRASSARSATSATTSARRSTGTRASAWAARRSSRSAASTTT